MAQDLAEYVLEELRATPAVTGLVVNSAGGILESGDASAQTVANAQTTRRETGNEAKILAVTVQDAGEKALNAQRSEQRVAIWLFDRERGYANIRLVTRAIYAALQGKSTSLTSPLSDRTVVIVIEMEARTGHRHEPSLEMDFELMTFKAIVHLDLG